MLPFPAATASASSTIAISCFVRGSSSSPPLSPSSPPPSPPSPSSPSSPPAVKMKGVLAEAGAVEAVGGAAMLPGAAIAPGAAMLPGAAIALGALVVWTSSALPLPPESLAANGSGTGSTGTGGGEKKPDLAALPCLLTASSAAATSYSFFLFFCSVVAAESDARFLGVRSLPEPIRLPAQRSEVGSNAEEAAQVVGGGRGQSCAQEARAGREGKGKGQPEEGQR
ncbi:hypothetical protein T492DRAFT_398447 [Pavlovales sp. CCMP2436]|nr:hypothetical protein T492DRAFT_398447 [Pavlovales sp. CCMP2436]